MHVSCAGVLRVESEGATCKASVSLVLVSSPVTVTVTVRVRLNAAQTQNSARRLTTQQTSTCSALLSSGAQGPEQRGRPTNSHAHPVT